MNRIHFQNGNFPGNDNGWTYAFNYTMRSLACRRERNEVISQIPPAKHASLCEMRSAAMAQQNCKINLHAVANCLLRSQPIRQCVFERSCTAHRVPSWHTVAVRDMRDGVIFRTLPGKMSGSVARKANSVTTHSPFYGATTLSA